MNTYYIPGENQNFGYVRKHINPSKGRIFWLYVAVTELDEFRVSTLENYNNGKVSYETSVWKSGSFSPMVLGSGMKTRDEAREFHKNAVNSWRPWHWKFS